MLHIPPTNLLLPAAKQKPFSGKSQENGPAEKDRMERVTGLSRRTKEEIVKWNQMTALRFQTVGRHQKEACP